MLQTWKANLLSLLGTGVATSLAAWVVGLFWALVRYGQVDVPLLLDPMFLLTLVFLVPGAGFLVGSMARRPPEPGTPAPPPPATWWERVAQVGLGWYLVVAGTLTMAELFLVDYLVR